MLSKVPLRVADSRSSEILNRRRGPPSDGVSVRSTGSCTAGTADEKAAPWLFHPPGNQRRLSIW